jgi:hypothetical protein
MTSLVSCCVGVAAAAAMMFIENTQKKTQNRTHQFSRVRIRFDANAVTFETTCIQRYFDTPCLKEGNVFFFHG